MQTKQHKNPLQTEESLFTQMLTKYMAYWPAFLIFLVLAMGGAYLYLRYAVPKYEATATLIIKDEKKGYDDSKMMESLNMISTKKIIENETEVLQSRPIMENVVKSLYLYAPVSHEGKIRSQSAYLSSPISVVAANPDSLSEVKKVYLDYDASKGTVLLDKRFGGKLNEWLNTPYGTLKFIVNTRFKPGVNDHKPFYFSLRDIKSVTEDILDNFKVVASNKLSSVINLSYRDEVPRRAEDILNQLIKAYNLAAVEEKNNLVKNTLSFVQERLSSVGGDLDSIEKKIQQYKTGTGAVDISTQGQLFLQNVSANDQKLAEVNTQLSVIDQLDKYVTSKDNNIGILPSNLGINDPSLAQMMTSLNNAELEREKLKKTVAENNPMLVAINDQINKIRPNIQANIESQRKNLEANRSSLSSSNGKYSSMLSTIPQKERQLLEISRDQNIKNGIYSFLLQKREESELSYASTISDSRVVNYAQSSSSPVSPNRMFIYIGAVLAALGLPILFIRSREILSRNVLYRQELESYTSFPIIGEVAYNKSAKPLVIESGKRTFIAEAFRKIRVSLLYLGIDSTHKKILVTSSISGEGKSFISGNLAVSLSLTGKKVVLVDMDLHNPGLGRIFDRPDEEFGVSDYLIGEKDPEEIIKRMPEHENLFYVSSGTLQPNPSELLENGKIQKLIAYLENVFDLVVIDTAPVVLVTDAYMLSSCCDATLYVVRHQYTPKMLVKRIDENNKINPLTNPAIIFNGVKTRGFFKNNYGYGYNYVYGYKPDTKKGKKKKNLEYRKA